MYFLFEAFPWSMRMKKVSSNNVPPCSGGSSNNCTDRNGVSTGPNRSFTLPTFVTIVVFTTNLPRSPPALLPMLSIRNKSFLLEVSWTGRPSLNGRPTLLCELDTNTYTLFLSLRKNAKFLVVKEEIS